MKIVVGADLVPTIQDSDLFSNVNIEKLIGNELKKLLKKFDFRIFNLEVPLTDTKSEIPKCGPNLIASPHTVAGMKGMDVDLFTLSNNHIMDQGERGLNDTISILEKNHIAYVGAGVNIEQAAKPYIIKDADKKIGIYACAEHEFTIAGTTLAGANPFNIIESFDHIEELKSACDYVIVLYHGGKEYYRYPSPQLQKNCRKMIDKGADLVVCQHTHCIGCEEKYKGGTVVYGQGNFIFDMDGGEFVKSSLLIDIDDEFNITYIPIVKKDIGIRLANDIEKEEILAAFKSRSEQIQDEKFVQRRYYEFADEMIDRYLKAFCGRNSILFRILNKLSRGKLLSLKVKFKYNKRVMLAVLNFIECEAHNELIVSGLKYRIKKM